MNILEVFCRKDEYFGGFDEYFGGKMNILEGLFIYFCDCFTTIYFL